MDGAKKAGFSYDPRTGRLSYEPRGRLSSKTHGAKISATDASGNTAVRRWSFTVGGG